jgi:hypothetical protein
MCPIANCWLRIAFKTRIPTRSQWSNMHICSARPVSNFQQVLRVARPLARSTRAYHRNSLYMAGLRPENTRLFQMPMRLVACTMQEQHPGDPIKSPLQPRTPLASHIRKNRRRRPLRQSLNSVLAMSPGSPESPTRSGFLSSGFASPLKTPVRSSPHEGAGVGSTSVFRWVAGNSA